MFGHFLALITVYRFWGLLSRKGILPGAKFTLRPSLALTYIGSVTARHSSSGRETKLCGVVHGMELRNLRSSEFSTEGAIYIPRAAITLGIGPHSSFIISVTHD